MHWLVTWLKQQGHGHFVFSLGYQGDQIEGWLKDAPVMAGTQWDVAHEQQPLGTGGAVRACLDFCGEDILIVNGDSLILQPLRPVFDLFDHMRADGVLVGLPMDDAGRYGTLMIGGDDRLTGFQEKRAGSGIINTGLYLLRKKILENVPTGQMISLEEDVMPRLIAEGKSLYVVKAEAGTPFIDIGTPESIARADDFIGRHFV